jgi:hypothetical protein
MNCNGRTRFFPRVLRTAQTDGDLQRPFEQPLHDEPRQSAHDGQTGNQRGQLRAELAEDVRRERRLRDVPAVATPRR